MKRVLVLLLAVVAVASLTVPALGASKKIRHRGELVGVPDSKVTLRVSINKGRPTKVSAFKAENVPTGCEKGDFLFRFVALDPTRVTRKGRFEEGLKNPDGSKLTISGRVRKRGRKVSGYLKTNQFDGGADTGTCRAPKTRFKTTKA